MNLLLLNPYFGEASDRSSESATNAPPLGLGYLATFIRDNSECKVEIVDPIPQGLNEDDVLEKIKKVDFVGLGCFTDTRFLCLNFAKRVKEVNPSCTLIIGGPFVFFLDELIIHNYPYIDVIVRGEGEFTLLKIVQGESFPRIDGITYRENGNIIRNKARSLNEDIDSFYIDYSLLPDFSLYRPDIEGDVVTKGLKTAYMIFSRGCPYKCTYCANDHWQRKWRIVSPETALQQVKILTEKYGIEFIRFYDDLFTLKKDWVKKFCYLVRSNNLNIKFRVLSRVGTQREVLEDLKSVGCTGVGIGIESGSDRILKRIRKGFNSTQANEFIKMCRGLGLWTVCSFIISLPDEKSQDVFNTIKLTKLCDVFVINIFHLHPGTPFYNELKNRNIVDDSIWFDSNMPTTIHYCRDYFNSANLFFNEAEWIILKVKYCEILFHPKKTIMKYGIVATVILMMFIFADLPLKGKLYKYSFRFKDLYRKLLWKSS